MNRSPLAASLFDNSPYYKARSAGLYPLGGGKVKSVPVTQELIDWADKIFVMEESHKQILEDDFNITDKHLDVLDIPDDFNLSLANDYRTLKGMLEEKLKEYLVKK
jgi:predicted protein tyrosine phosphatase